MAGDGTNSVFGGDRALSRVAERMAALAAHLAGAIRAELLLRLAVESSSASELAREVGVDDARMSRLLGELRAAGVATHRGVGRPRIVVLGPHVRVERDDGRLTLEIADEAGITLSVSVRIELLDTVSRLDGGPRRAAPSRG